ncbi:WD repeat protein [Drechmeria coniospora]|uniref:Probable cytosolic iron-sulfur protein assembly protein 1 n=1 Tax=Drechmeria coniospora TaxID=98403 RepID=A0A151GAU5_DRECN|nr:WD repeat protein [Drechmeria coniospora]KYK54213.1 WD repeat protein [Drechmeria coniospora]
MSPSSEPSSTLLQIIPLPLFQPDLYERAWASVPHPTLPLLATAHSKGATVFSLSTLSSHSTLTGGHARSVRSVAWKPGQPPQKLCLVTGSFDSTAGLWRWEADAALEAGAADDLEVDMSTRVSRSTADGELDSEPDGGTDKSWEFTLVLEGHDSEIKSCTFSPSGTYLATCSRDKSVWIWEDIGASEDDDEWETVAVLNEHEGDVKAVAWCPDVPGRNRRRHYSPDVLASASYDNTVRIWREDGDGEWVCVAVLEGHDETVWGLQWEPRPRDENQFPRLLTFSADKTIRIWSLKEEAEADDDGPRVAFSGIPNTMRKSLREEWNCTAVLPKAHDRDVYSATWSADSGLIASTGSDGRIAMYKEGNSPAAHVHAPATKLNDPSALSTSWEVIATMPNAHGAFEVNHITWCRRYDAGSERRGEEEMLVTTGDDGLVRPWQVKQEQR